MTETRNEMSLLGLDVGTTGCKAIAFDNDGNILASAYQEYNLLNPHPGHYELDPESVWQSLVACIRKANAGVACDPVRALAVSTQGEAIIPVSADYRVLAPSPVSSDNRAFSQTRLLSDSLDSARIYAITGQLISPMYSIPKIMWWRDHKPELFQQVWKFLCYGEFIALRLGLAPVIDYTMAARTLGFDIRSFSWSEEILDLAGISKSCLAEVAPSGTAIGKIPVSVAKSLGFVEDVEVVLGGHDQPCAALGSGTLDTGQVMYSIGTTEAIAAVLEAPNPSLYAFNVPCYPHVVAGSFVALAGNQTGGRLLRWYRDVLGDTEQSVAEHTGRDVYDIIVEQVNDQPSQLLLLPYFAGSGTLHNDQTVKGAILGLTFDTDKAEIIKAILEGVTYEQALVLKCLHEAGVPIDCINAVGGGTKSETWMRIKANILNKPLRTIRVHDGASLGAAFLAGWGTGVYQSLKEAVGTCVKTDVEYTPVLSQSQVYAERIDLYATLYSLIKQIPARF